MASSSGASSNLYFREKRASLEQAFSLATRAVCEAQPEDVIGFLATFFADLKLQSASSPSLLEPQDSPAPLSCHLLFSDINQGTFFLQWATGEMSSCIEDSLAAFVPQRSVPAHKTRDGGRTELCRDVGSAHKKKFFEGERELSLKSMRLGS